MSIHTISNAGLKGAASVKVKNHSTAGPVGF